jgi:cytochrome c-type biogenesis protein CcmH/NrfG
LNQNEQSLRENPNEARSHFIYGLILLKKNRQNEATQSFEKALQLNPDLAEARENLKKLRGEK